MLFLHGCVPKKRTPQQLPPNVDGEQGADLNNVLHAENFLTFALSSWPSDANHIRRIVYETLTSMGVPILEQAKLVQNLSRVAEAAVSTNTIVAGIFDATLIQPALRDGDEDGDGDVVLAKLITESKSSNQGLEQVTLDDTVITHTPGCPICMVDFAGTASVKPITALPCAHHYHVHCVVQWMEKSHLCPLCRYAMPVEDDDHSNGAGANPTLLDVSHPSCCYKYFNFIFLFQFHFYNFIISCKKFVLDIIYGV
ncbi:hypothetical protein ACLB2K_061565 [Fragaria x ananassa]